MAVLLRSLPLLLSALLAGQVLAADGPVVEVVPVKQMAVRDELITFGSLRSDESVMIRPEIEGRLASLHFREGQAVTAGDLLVSLDDAIARAELAQARANLDLAEKNPRATEVMTVELRQSAKVMKEYANPRFAEFLKLLAGVIDEGQRHGALDASIPAPVLARAIFGLLDELTLMWVAGRGERLDIQKVPEWVSSLVLRGILSQKGQAT